LAEYYVVYWDIEDHQPRQSFEVLGSPPEGSMIRDQIIPGQPPARPIYIRWHHLQIESDAIHLLTCTHEILKAGEVRALVLQAYKFVQGRN
jgi:hypothetical protein